MTGAAKLAVLISGYGSNLQAIIDAIESGGLNGVRVVCVISDRPGTYGLERARRHGIPAVHFPYPPRAEGEAARRARDGELADLLGHYGAQWVVLAGWLRVLSSEFLVRFPNRVVNLHPALPGQYPGLDAIARAFRACQPLDCNEQSDAPQGPRYESARGEPPHGTFQQGAEWVSHRKVGETGVTVHFVPDEEVDAGPVIASETVPIYSGDTVESLSERVHAVEHRLLVHALSQLLLVRP